LVDRWSWREKVIGRREAEFARSLEIKSVLADGTRRMSLFISGADFRTYRFHVAAALIQFGRHLGDTTNVTVGNATSEGGWMRAKGLEDVDEEGGEKEEEEGEEGLGARTGRGMSSGGSHLRHCR